MKRINMKNEYFLGQNLFVIPSQRTDKKLHSMDNKFNKKMCLKGKKYLSVPTKIP